MISYQVTSCPCDTSATIMTLCLLVFEQGRTIHANKAIYPVSMCKTSNYEPILLLQQTRRSELVGRAGGGCYSKPRFMITFFWVAYCLVGPLFCLYSPSPLASEITTNRHTTRSWYVPHECLGNDFEALPFYPYLPVAR